jgi:hypothetical protein
MNEKLREIWSKIERSAVYHVSIGIAGATATAVIEAQEGITCKKKKDSLVFTHRKTKIQIPVTKDITFSEFPGGSARNSDCLGIYISSSDFRTEVIIEFAGGKTGKKNNKPRKKPR